MRFSRDAFDTHHLRAMTERLHWHRKPAAKAVPLATRTHLHRAHGRGIDDAALMKVTVVSTAVVLAVVLAAMLAIGFGSEMARLMGLE
ncbi:hypothetical protein LMG7141_02711 [Ralstonia condita]|jgi:hypothetical protein|uniref:Transmembrane protein n=1 Tax=Ralstonia condita TaxID=3058600 RepID=A0ABN9ITT9_9RALS|nr:hypothetical protein [Ralstonia sp. LMG 7141]MDE2202040.1 hypothetical protein [Burkholderiaceae bacterium]CAJ0792820.1 hypothetical protein LMG7141_02711 [Ralstonia sp. LMG 7141]